MRSVYLSAHLDDAILSCGGLIFDQIQKGIPAVVWTFMCGIPQGKPEENYLRRIEEDKRAAQILGARPVHEHLLDAFGRNYENVFSPPSSDDDTLISNIASIIEEKTESDDRLMVPLALGGHVDHVILRRAAELSGMPLTYYIDFPYVEYLPDALKDVPSWFVKHATTVSPEGLSHWVDAVREYVSQDFYKTPDITREKIIEYWAKVNGIFLWEQKSVEQIFSEGYYTNLWKDQHSLSGPGSTLEETMVARRAIPEIISKYEIKSILDLPCGDFFWMRLVDFNIDYTGADIVMDEIRMNQKNYGSYQGRRFVYADLLGDYIPTVELLFCRDCLPHFSQKDALMAVKNIKSSACRYLLTTTFPEAKGDWDIATGAWRPINLQASPYNFPPPLELFDERSPNTLYGTKCLALWAIKDLEDNL